MINLKKSIGVGYFGTVVTGLQSEFDVFSNKYAFRIVDRPDLPVLWVTREDLIHMKEHELLQHLADMWNVKFVYDGHGMIIVQGPNDFEVELPGDTVIHPNTGDDGVKFSTIEFAPKVMITAGDEQPSKYGKSYAQTVAEAADSLTALKETFSKAGVSGADYANGLVTPEESIEKEKKFLEALQAQKAEIDKKIQEKLLIDPETKPSFISKVIAQFKGTPKTFAGFKTVPTPTSTLIGEAGTEETVSMHAGGVRGCDNPRCKYHEVFVHPASLAASVMTMPSMKFGVEKYEAPKSVHKETTLRHKVCRVIEGVTITGHFCDTCFEAISMVEGWS